MPPSAIWCGWPPTNAYTNCWSIPKRRLAGAACSKPTTDNFPALGADGWDDINYSLALYDTLGGYMSRDEVDAQTVLAAWHHPLQNIAEPVARFMEFRRRNGVSQPWAYLHYLLEKSRAYRCTCPTSGQP
jgi:hypothetical protein